MNYNTEDREKIRKAILEMNDSMTRVAAERDLQKAIVNRISEVLELDKSVFRRMAKTYFKGAFPQEQDTNEQFEETYVQVFSDE